MASRSIVKVAEHAVRTLFNKFIADRSGATAIEYGLISAFVGVAIIGALQLTGPALVATFLVVASAL